MLSVPLEHLENLPCQLGIQTQTLEVPLVDIRLSKVLIVKIVESAVFLLRHVANSMESLDVPTPQTNQRDIKSLHANL